MKTAQNLVGEVIGGRYEILRPIGEGGMGAIYLATQQPLGRDVVLKVLLDTFAHDTIAAQRFETEALAISRLVHPNIVTIYDYGKTDGNRLYIVMEYLQGRTLREAAFVEPFMAPAKARSIISGITQGLVEAHRYDIIHRDLKPENIMIVRAGEDDNFPKILDFGLARSVAKSEVANSRLTAVNIIAGTPCYVSPERALNEDEDHRSDLYSLGAIWYEMLTGAPPLEYDSALETLSAQVNEIPPPPSTKVQGSIPRGDEKLIMALLEKAPQDRPQSASDLLAAIRELDKPSQPHPNVRAAANTPRQAPIKPSGEPEVSDLHFDHIIGLGDEPILLTQRKTGESTPPIQLKKRKPAFERRKKPRLDRSLEAFGSHVPEPTDEQQPLMVSLSEESVDMGVSSHVLEQTIKTMRGAKSADELALILRNFLRRYFDRCVIFDVTQHPARVHTSAGYAPYVDLPDTLLKSAALQGLLDDNSTYMGAPPRTKAWQQTSARLGGRDPTKILAAVAGRPGQPFWVIVADARDPKSPLRPHYLTDIMEDTVACLTMLLD